MTEYTVQDRDQLVLVADEVREGRLGENEDRWRFLEDLCPTVTDYIAVNALIDVPEATVLTDDDLLFELHENGVEGLVELVVQTYYAELELRELFQRMDCRDSKADSMEFEIPAQSEPTMISDDTEMWDMATFETKRVDFKKTRGRVNLGRESVATLSESLVDELVSMMLEDAPDVESAEQPVHGAIEAVHDVGQEVDLLVAGVDPDEEGVPEVFHDFTFGDPHAWDEVHRIAGADVVCSEHVETGHVLSADTGVLGYEIDRTDLETDVSWEFDFQGASVWDEKKMASMPDREPRRILSSGGARIPTASVKKYGNYAVVQPDAWALYRGETA